MRFISLFKKEIREMLTFQTFIGLFIGVIVLVIMGSFISNVNTSSSEDINNINIIDNDNSNLSNYVIKKLEDTLYNIIILDNTENAPSGTIVIPEGFESNINKGIPQNIDILTNITSFSFTNNIQSANSIAAHSIINEIISENIINNQTNLNNQYPTAFIKSPVTYTEITSINDKSAVIPSAIIMNFASSQTLFIPIVIFILIAFASQMTASTIASEKGDKTLETLLTTPVPRLSVLLAKISSSGVISLVMAVIYMFGFSSYIGSFTNPIDTHGSTQDSSIYLDQLGINLTVTDFTLIGVQLFLTILIALSISIILGALSKDIKSAQTNIAPLMFLVFIPYLITMFVDVSSLPILAKILVYAIPFTHSFSASANLIFGNYSMFFFGVVYQLIVISILLFIAVKIFSSDILFTMNISLSRKKKKKQQM